MNVLICRRLALLSILAPVVFDAGAAQAHPHVRVAASGELVFAIDGSITGVRHAWTFDDMFSTYAVQGIATRKMGVYSREELAPLAQTNVEALKKGATLTIAGFGVPAEAQNPGTMSQKWTDYLSVAAIP